MLFIKDSIRVSKRTYAYFECPVCLAVVERRKDAGLRNKSCGCVFRKELIKHPAYSIWEGMVQRCHNPKSTHYSWYGGKGISICAEWRAYSESFLKWADANGFEKGLTIDRIDSSGNYEPANCRWITKSENSKRSVQTKFSKWTQESISELQHLKKSGLTYSEIGLQCNISASYAQQLVTKNYIPKVLREDINDCI